MGEFFTAKIKVGVSACAYGCRFRYNGKGWDQIAFIGRDRSSFIWFPMCPEVNANLGVPRSSIHIAGTNGSAVWDGQGKVINASGEDLTERLMASSDWYIQQLKKDQIKIFIFMEGSPSCGVYRTTLKNKRLGKPPGVFGHRLLEEGIFLIPAQDLSSPIKWWDWRRRAFAFMWLDEQTIDSRDQLSKAWHTLKFLCQEINEKRAREIGHQIGSLGKEHDQDDVFFKNFKREVSDILRNPSTVPKIKNRLWKHYIHYRKVTGQEIDSVLQPQDLRSMTNLADELLQMELKAMETGVLFGASPISNRKPKQSAAISTENKPV